MLSEIKKIKYSILEKLDALLTLLSVYMLEILYLLIVFLLIYFKIIILSIDQILTLLTVIPLPLVAIHYIKKRNNETELTWINEHIDFNENFLKNKEGNIDDDNDVKWKHLKFRKLIFKFSILKSLKRSSHTKKELLGNLFQLVDFKLEREKDKTFDFIIDKDKRIKKIPNSIDVIEGCINEITTEIIGFKDAFGFLYTTKHLSYKYQLFNKLRYQERYEFKWDKFEKMLEDNPDEVKIYIDCEFVFKNEINKKFPYQDFQNIFKECRFYKNEEKVEYENLFKDEEDKSTVPNIQIIKKSRDYRTIGDNTYLAQGWFVIRKIDYESKYKDVNKIKFVIEQSDSKTYTITFGKEQLDELISYKFYDIRRNYHFYFWIKEDGNGNVYLIDGRNSLNKTYNLGIKTSSNSYEIPQNN